MEVPFACTLRCVACASTEIMIANVQTPADDWDWTDEFSIDVGVVCLQCGHHYTHSFFQFTDEDGKRMVLLDTNVSVCTGGPNCPTPCGPPPEAIEPPPQKPRLRLMGTSTPEGGA